MALVSWMVERRNKKLSKCPKLPQYENGTAARLMCTHNRPSPGYENLLKDGEV